MLRLVLLLCLSILFACGSSQKAAPAPRPKTVSQPKPTPIATTSEAGSITWLDSERLMPVLEQAQREKKPVFVEFYASWCAPCKVMEEEIFTQQPTFTYLNKNFLNFRTDFDSPSGKTIASIYEVKTLPTVLFLDPQGVVLERHTGIANPSVLTSLGNSALAKMKK
jgi:thiol:disulfide interchange protein